MSLIQWIDFKEIGDHRGSLVALEGSNDIPFDIKRIYYLFGMQPDLPRGFHAHRELIQVAVCIKGQCDILMDDGRSKQTVILNSPAKGLVINKMQWHEMHNFSDDCVLLVLASDVYDEVDYIRDYSDFLTVINNA
ncbi:FdtA/QdtA family cupin domain-containing protein [Vibrio vulnificus]|uniref:sugar 3,4-ketoisomerase n=1 Tax=Vibrio vulnificus TaxID=672 RepID=UPI001029987C|nr:FdtA/QdtA family cupin domain-containing protein [Vibrio vulnificus]EGQ9302069.1 WxcM-like domain-containing protein [Vibrio vulnificus]EGR1891027.1 WxcM-like domain-containing protein [Vibrio vulnificus]EHY9870341.1 WxcM-like domain-containing protein [Vibrio vulnificus]EIC2760892.1 WxcM-like domain-containing protein [Vibrio vulnificus]RZP55544.1 WxcM-like domain-containing protein [Vibrio vulnificus]